MTGVQTCALPISDEFGVEIPDEEIENFHTVGDVVVYVEEHMQ